MWLEKVSNIYTLSYNRTLNNKKFIIESCDVATVHKFLERAVPEQTRRELNGTRCPLAVISENTLVVSVCHCTRYTTCLTCSNSLKCKNFFKANKDVLIMNLFYLLCGFFCLQCLLHVLIIRPWERAKYEPAHTQCWFVMRSKSNLDFNQALHINDSAQCVCWHHHTVTSQ